MRSLATALLFLTVVAGPSVAQSSVTPNCGAGELPKAWEGQAYAVSGDTLAAAGLKAPIKLWGIRAPDIDRAESVTAMRARAALEDMLASVEHKVSCKMVHRNNACEAVAQCTVTASWPTGSAPQQHDLAIRLVEDGFAYGAGLESPPDWDKYASEKVAHFEAIARQARKGLWPLWLGETPKP